VTLENRMSEKSSDPRKQAIRDFLEEVKQTITGAGSGYQSWRLVKRKENVECITELGFTYDDVRDAILGLSVADYCAGLYKTEICRGTCGYLARSRKAKKCISN